MRAPALQRRWIAVAAATAFSACSESADPHLRLRSIAPAQATQGTAVAIRIEGEGLAPHVLTHYGDQGDSVVDARFQAWLGEGRLRDVRPSGDGALLAVAPEDLGAGAHDLTVVDPGGKRATLAGAFRVLSPSDGEALVASFRIEPVGAQTAGAPFAITVTALDASGAPVGAFSGSVAVSDRTGALVPTAIGPFAWGAWTGPVEVRASAGADALAVSDGLGHAGRSNAFAVLPAPAARVAFGSPPVDAPAGACAGPVTVALEDLYGAPTFATAAVDVAISGAVEVYADAACAVPAPGATVAAGAAGASVFVRSTVAAPFTLDAAAAGLAPTAQPGLVRPAAPARLVFTTPPQTVAAGACSAAAAVRSEDAFGNVSPVPADAAVALSSSAASGLSFHADAACGGGPVAEVILAGGSSAATFWFRATTAEAVAVAAAGAGIALPASQAEAIVPAAPTALAFVTPAQTVAAGSCSGVATVEARDAWGNAAPVSAATAIALAAAPPASFGFHLDPACADAPGAATSLPAGATRASFWFRATATGSYAVTASGAGLPVPAAQPQTVGPAAADRLVFTSAPKAAVAGACSGPLTVEVRDGLGNPAPAAAATPFTPSAAPSTGTALYPTPDCSGPEGGPGTIPAGSATGTFSFRSTRAGTFDATAAVAGLTAARQPQSVAPAAADRLVFTTAPETVAAGGCSGVLTVEARDAYDNVATVATDTSVTLAAAPAAGFVLHDASGCGGQPIADVVLATGASTASFRFTGTAAGLVTVTATGAGIPGSASQAETILPAAPDRLVFTTAAQTVMAGSCSAPAVVEARDAYGNVAPVPALTAVALSAAPADGFAFHASPGCGDAPVGSVALPAGASSTTFWFRGTVAGAPLLTASGAGVAIAASQGATIVPAPPERLVVTTAAQTVTAGSCSGAVTVEARDVHGNVAPVAALTTVALAASPSTGVAFFDSGGCGGAPVTSVDLAAGGATATFWFRGTVAGTPTVTATGAGIPAAAGQAETIAAAAPERLVFTTAAHTVTAGRCSGALTVEARDVHGNVAPVAALTGVALAAAPPVGFAFHATADCGGAPVTSVDLAAGASSATFWFQGTAAGLVTITAMATGIPGNASQGETILPDAPDRLVFTTPPQTLAAGACSGAATVEARDPHGNAAPVAALTAVALSAAPGTGFEFFDAAGCGSAPVASASIPAGATRATLWFRGTVAGTSTITASGTGIGLAATQPATVLPAAPDRLVVTSAPHAVVAGACSGAVVVEARDVHGNVAPVQALTAVALSAAPGASFSFFDAAGCGGAPVASVDVAAGASGTTFWFSGTVAGPLTVAAAGAGIATPATQGETIVPAAPGRLVFTSPPQTVVAGSCSAPAALEAQDVYGNVAPVAAPSQVDLSATPATGFELFDGAGCGGAPVTSVTLPAGGSATTFRFRGTVAGTPTVAAAGVAIPVPASQTETIVPDAPVRLAFTSAPQTVTAGACSGAAVVEARDVHGNAAPVAALTIVALSATPAAGLAFHDQAGCATAPVGSVSIAAGATTATFWFSGTLAGTPALTAAGAGIAGAATQGTTIVPGVPDRLVITSAPQAVAAGACSGAVAVEARDVHGNVAQVPALTAIALSASPAAGFAFHGTSDCGAAPVTSVDLAAGASGATFWFRGTAAGPVAVAAIGAGLPIAATQAETIVPAAPAAVVFTSAPQTVAAGACSGTARLELRDAFDNPTADAGAAIALALSASPGAGLELFEDDLCAVAVPGASIAVPPGSTGKDFWFRGTVATSETITSAPAGLAPASQLERVVPAAPDRLVFTSPPQTPVAGACAPATLEARDVHGNVAPVSAPTAVALAASPSFGLSFFGAAGCGGDVVSSVELAAGAAGTTFWFRGTAAGAVALTATGTGIGLPATQTETVVPAAADRLVFRSPPQTLTAGDCSAALSVEAEDAFGNVAPVAALTSIALSAAPPAGVTFHDQPGCGAAPVASVDLPAGASGGSFWLRGTVAGTRDVTALAAGIASAATQTETIVPAAPDRLVFTSAAQTVTAGVCSAAVTLEVRDVHGNASPVAAPTAVALSASPPDGFELFDAPGCGGTSIASVSVPTGASAATFWFRGTLAGAPAIGAAGAGIPNAATQVETVTPAAPDRLVFTSAPQTRVAGDCSGAATVEARDPYGNVAPVAALTAVSLAAAPPAGFAFHDQAGCGTGPVASVSIAASATSATFWFRGTAAGAVDVTATGVSIPNPAAQQEVVDPAPPASVVFTSPAQTAIAGRCSGAVRLELRDAFGNPTADPGGDVALALSATPAAGLELFEDPVCAVAVPGAAIAIAAGGAGKDLWFRGTLATAVTLAAAPAGLAGASQVETVAPAAPARIAFASAPASSVAGVCSAAVTVVSLDAYDNVAPASGATPVALGAAPSASFELHDGSGCGGAPIAGTTIAAGATTGTFFFRGTLAGAVTVTASALGTTADQVETVTPAAPDRLTFTTAPQTVVAGTCGSAAMLEARDAYGNLAPAPADIAVALSASPASSGLLFYASAGCGGLPVPAVTLAAGTTGASFWFRGALAGSVAVAASGGGMTVGATQSETVVAGTPDRIGFTTAPQTLVAGACSAPVTVALEDAGGNQAPVSASTAVALAASPSTGVTFYAGPGCGGTAVASVTIPTGASSQTFSFRANQTGNVTVTATGAGVPIPADQVEVIQPAPYAGLAFDWIPSPQKQSGVFTVTVRAVDAYGNPTPTFTGTAVLSATPNKYKTTCTVGCAGANTTTPFVAGVWSGGLNVQPHGSGVQLVATAGAVVGSSNPFDVVPTVVGTPPIALGSVSPVVIVAGQAASFDASASSDLETPLSQLQVSWDFTGAAAGAPGGAGWTTWLATKSASNTYTTPGTYQPRVAAMDTDGVVSTYALGTVVVVAAASDRCVVTAATMVDDGAQSCSGTLGADGVLSLPEALRLAGGRPITFSGPLAIAGAGSLAVTAPASVYAARSGTGAPTVFLDLATPIDVSAALLLAGVELRNALGASASSLFVEAGGALTLEDAYVHDSSRIRFAGSVTLRRARLAACVGPCLEQWAPTGVLSVSGSLLQNGGDDAIRFTQCGDGSWLDVSSTVITGFATGVRATCVLGGTTRVRNVTFHANGTGIAYDGGGRAHDLRNAIFSSQTGTAVTCGTVQPYQFVARSHHLLFANGADGCVAADPYVLTSDPLFLGAATGDFRLAEGSPARDGGVDTGIDVNGAAPGTYSGGRPDRGGRETW